MRISDWSSDVCSSDLKGRPSQNPEYPPAMAKSAPASPRAASPRAVGIDFGNTNTVVAIADADGSVTPVRFSHADVVRSEERRVGKEFVSQGRYRWPQYHYKQI